MSYQSNTAIIAGYQWVQSVEITAGNNIPFPANCTIIGHVRETEGSNTVLTTVSTANSSIIRVSNTEIQIVISGDASVNWKAGDIVMDLVRTDTSPYQHTGLRFDIPVVLPITRNLT